MPAASETVVLSTRFHRAARDGLPEIVVEASSRDANTRDKEGLSPTAWASFCGHIDVLRVLVSRGGTPSKCDRFGNTSLHLAAAGGHAKCVSFLIAMGEDVWALNIDFRTPRDLAAACDDGEAALRLLDSAMARESAIDPKKVKAKKEKARHRAQKMLVEFRRYHEKEKLAEELELQDIMERSQSMYSGTGDHLVDSLGRRFSEASLASSTATGATSSSIWSAVRLQALQRGRRASNNSKASSAAQSNTSGLTNTSGFSQNRLRTYQFKVGSITSDGSRTARQLPGLAPSTEVLYVNGANNQPRRSSILSHGSTSTVPLDSVTDAFELAQQTGHAPDTLVVLTPPGDSDNEDDLVGEKRRTSIFDRPGFGNMAFRHSLGSIELSPSMLQNGNNKESNWTFKKPESDTVDGAENDQKEDDVFDDEEEHSPLHAFLVAWGLPQLSPQLSPLFHNDLDALMSVTEEDLTGLPIGPRKKLLRAIELRNETLESPSAEDIETKL